MTRLLFLFVVLIRTMTLAADPVVSSFEDVVQRLPKDSTFASTKRPYAILKGEFDVKKSTSLVTPIVGRIDFRAEMESPSGAPASMSLRLEFAHKDGKWEFLRLLNATSRKDITPLPLGRDMLESGRLQQFLAEFRKTETTPR